MHDNPVVSEDARIESLFDRIQRRVPRLSPLFMWTVLAPTVLAIIYYGIFAANIYVSESKFLVKSQSHQASTNIISQVVQGGGLSGASTESYAIIDYIQSRDALRILDGDGAIRKTYSTEGDFLSRYHEYIDGSFESLWRYYKKKIVDPVLNEESSIVTLDVKSFNARESQDINEKLLGMSEALVNKMNDRSLHDSVDFYVRAVQGAQDYLKSTAIALASYRSGKEIYDPDKQSSIQLQQVALLQGQLFAAQTKLSQLQSVSPSNPQVSVLKANISSLKEQISSSSKGITGGDNALSGKASEYTRLELDSAFAAKQLSAALGALETARGDAQKKQIYVERLVEPSLPDEAVLPRRIRAILTVLISGLVAWATLGLLLASIREHRD